MNWPQKASAITLLALMALFGCFGGKGFCLELKQGPILLGELPQGLGEPLSSMGNKALIREKLPAPLVKMVAGIVAEGNGVLIVGYTDTVGPRLLNNSLGLQYAVNAANRLSTVTGAPSWLFSCASAGEELGGEESGISVYAVKLPKEAPRGETNPVSILSPPAGGEVNGRFWSLWEGEVSDVVWGIEDEKGKVTAWRVNGSVTPLELPYPARSVGSALGVGYPDDNWVFKGGWKLPEVVEQLTLSVESLDTGSARLSGKLGKGYGDVVVWAGGIPYPASIDNGKFEVSVARFENDMEVYAQATDPKGSTVVGPLMTLPRSLADSPKLLAVLTWVGEDIDLDIHAWVGKAHTHPQDPDPAYSSKAAQGTRILFDGDTRTRATALWVDDTTNLEMDVRCFTDLGGGATAYMYIVIDPGDPVMRRGLILGPRRLSGEPSESRWPILSLKGE